MNTIRIVVADDHELIHSGIEDILQNHTEFIIVGHAYNGIEVVELTEKLNPDIILMDISMPKMNGIEASLKIIEKHPDIKIIALSQHERKEYVSQMLKAGCFGYLLKNSRKEEILSAIESVSQNKKYLNPNMIDVLMQSDKEEILDKQILTKRELEILEMIAVGNNNPEIANELSISVRTVETHRRNLMQKLKVNSVVELLRYASRHNLIDL